MSYLDTIEMLSTQKRININTFKDYIEMVKVVVYSEIQNPPSIISKVILDNAYGNAYDIIIHIDINKLKSTEINILVKEIDGRIKNSSAVNKQILNKMFNLYMECFDDLLTNSTDQTKAFNDFIATKNIAPDFFKNIKDVILTFVKPSSSKTNKTISLNPSDTLVYDFMVKDFAKSKKEKEILISLGLLDQGHHMKNKELIRNVFKIWTNYYIAVLNDPDQEQAILDYLSNNSVTNEILDSIKNAVVNIIDSTQYQATMPKYADLVSHSSKIPPAPIVTTPMTTPVIATPMTSTPPAIVTTSPTPVPKITTILDSNDETVYNFVQINDISTLSSKDIKTLVMLIYLTYDASTDDDLLDDDITTLRDYYTFVFNSADEIDAANQFANDSGIPLSDIDTLKTAFLTFINSPVVTPSSSGSGLSQYFKNVKSISKPIISNTKSNISRGSHSLVNYFNNQY